MRRDESSLLDIALDEVWKTATRDVPELLAAIEPLLPKKSSE
jgi:uncharacterized protein with HEPN domain